MPRTRFNRALLLTAGLASAAVLGLSQPALAGQGQAPLVTPHQHFIVTATGERVSFGPNACGEATGSPLHRAFSEFHAHVHRGPANDAFDHLHNPVDVVATRC